MSTNQNRQEAECQTVLQCTPHILSREEEAVVQSDATCQTLVSCEPQNSNSQLCPLLSYTNPEEIKQDAIKELNLPRVRKLQFILPEGHVDSDDVSRDNDTTDQEHTDSSEPRNICEELQALREEKAEEEQMNDVSNKSDDNTEPKLYCEEFSALDKEKEEEVQKNKDVSKESVRNSIDQDGVQIQSILKHYPDDEPTRSRRRRRVKNVDADCQTNLMVYPYMLSPFDTAVVKCDLSVQTSVTCHPTCSVSDILPKLKSYIVHEGRQTEATSGGDNKNNTSVLDLLKGLINEVENSHQHMFDPSYRPPTVPRELTEFEHDAVEPKARVKREKSATPGDFTYPAIKSEPPDIKDVKIKLEKIEPVDSDHTEIKQELLEYKSEPIDDKAGILRDIKSEPTDFESNKIKQELLKYISEIIDDKAGIMRDIKGEPSDFESNKIKQELLQYISEIIDDKAAMKDIKGEPGDFESNKIKQEQFYDMPVFDMKNIDVKHGIVKKSDSQSTVKEEKPEGDLDDNSSDIVVTDEWVHSNIVATYDLTEDDTMYDEINEIIAYLTDKATEINETHTPAPDTIPNYNINIYINNYITQTANSNLGLIDTQFQLNIIQSNQIPPFLMSFKQIENGGNVQIHDITSAVTQSEKQIEQLESPNIACTSRVVPQQQNLESKTSEQNDSSEENYIHDTHRGTEELLPCTTIDKYQPNITRLCDALLDQFGPSASESSGSLNEVFIENQYSSEPSEVIQSEQPTTFNMYPSTDCLISLNEAFFKEPQYPSISPHENLALSPYICDNVEQQNCPTDNVCSIVLVSDTDKPYPHENIPSSFICFTQDPFPEMLPSTDFNNSHNMYPSTDCLISLNESFLRDPSKPSQQNFVLSPYICDNVEQQNCPTDNVCSVALVPTASNQCMHTCSELLNETLIENSSKSSELIQPEQPIIFNNSHNIYPSSDCLISLNEAFFKETQYSSKPAQDNFVLASNICNNAGQQDCPIDNVCSVALVPTTDKPNPHENIQPPSCHVQDPISKSTKSRVNFQKPVVAQTILSTTTIIIADVMSGEISTVTNRNIPPVQTSPLHTKPSKHASCHKKDTEASNQPAYTDDLRMETEPLQMLCEECTVGYFVEQYMEELADEYKVPSVDDKVVDVPIVEEHKHNFVYNSSSSSCYIEPYTAVGYAAEYNVKNQIDQSSPSSKYIPQSEENDLGMCDSKPELPWSVVNLQPNIKISYVNKEKSETDLSNEEEIPTHLPPLLPIPVIPVTDSMIFRKTCAKNESYTKKLAKQFSVEKLSSDTDIAWDKFLLPRRVKIRKMDKPKVNKEVEEVLSSKSLPCICKSGYVLPVRVHRNIDLLCRNVESSENECTCVEPTDSPSTIVILPPRSRHFLSTKFPVEQNNSASLTKTKKNHKGKPLKSILSDKELKSTASKKSVTFMDSKSSNSKKKTKLVPSTSESSVHSCKCCKSETSKLSIPTSETRKIRVKVKKSKSQDSNTSSTPRSLTPVPTKEKIDDSKMNCDPCNKPLEVKSSLSSAALKVKPDRVFMALSACETEFKPIKQALNNVQEKLRNLNMPELDCIFNKEPAYTVGKEKFNISAGYKLDQSNQGSFKYNGMNSNGMNNQYNTFSGIGCSNVSPTLRYSHTSNTYHQPNAMYHSFRAPETFCYPRQHQNYYSLPDSNWSGTNYGNNYDFPSPAESIASKYSLRNVDHYDYDEDFINNLYEPDYIPSQYSVHSSEKHKRKRKDRSKDKKVSVEHNYDEDSRNVPDSNLLQDPYFDDDESSYDYCSNYRNPDKYSRDPSKSKMRCNCKKPPKTASRIKSNKKNRTRQSKINVKTSDSQCTVYDVIKSLFISPDGKHNNKNTPRLTRKDIEHLCAQMQSHSKKDKHKHN